MTFFEYMMKYLDKASPAGDLARDMDRDNIKFPRSNNKNEILSYLRAKGAYIGCLDTFKKCYRQYKKTQIKTAAPQMYHYLILAMAKLRDGGVDAKRLAGQ